jgi:UDP-N-acetylmuramoyl-tripeptide--D-alanyl-D-alanine ligase
LTLAALVLIASCVVASLRWLRVAQYEHYLAGSCMRFARRWFRSGGVNAALGPALVASAVGGVFVWPLHLVAAACVLAWPVGLGLRGRTSKLRWTRRMKTLAIVALVLAAVVVVVLTLIRSIEVAAAVFATVLPFFVDAACALTKPVEDRLARRYVDKATTRLQAVRPRVVAITGSYGKTSTKEHLRDVVSGSRTVVASPASFNNRAGLSRTVLDHLVPGTQVFIAEMGMYGPGEIADLCAWIHPEIAIITAIGSVHLERVGSIERIVEAKREILVGAQVAILNVDAPELAQLADEVAATQRVVRCGSAATSADVVVQRTGTNVSVRTPGGSFDAPVPDPAVEPTNLACAIAAALELGVELDMIERAIARLESPAHRCTVATAPNGVVVIDDTFSSNREGADRALRVLAETDGTRRIVSTPGIVELGERQFDENESFGKAAGALADVVVIIGATNRAALRDGAGPTGAELVEVRHRDQAVAWVRSHTAPGDVVLYENDLPDHYP